MINYMLRNIQSIPIMMGLIRSVLNGGFCKNKLQSSEKHRVSPTVRNNFRNLEYYFIKDYAELESRKIPQRLQA